MANTLIEQMLEHLINDEIEKAHELFHEFAVVKSREIYETLIESEINDTYSDYAFNEEDEEDELDIPGDDDEDLDLDDPTDSLVDELEDEVDDLEGFDDEVDGDATQNLQDAIDELQAAFDELQSNMGSDDVDMDVDDEVDVDVDMDDEGDMDVDVDDEDDEITDDFDLKTVREYVEKVSVGHGAEKKGAGEKADNTKSVIDNCKNDMGGTSSNIVSGKSSEGKGKGLLDKTPKDISGDFHNTVGKSATKTAFKSKVDGHGAEKKGSSSASEGQSLFRNRR